MFSYPPCLFSTHAQDTALSNTEVGYLGKSVPVQWLPHRRVVPAAELVDLAEVAALATTLLALPLGPGATVAERAELKRVFDFAHELPGLDDYVALRVYHQPAPAAYTGSRHVVHRLGPEDQRLHELLTDRRDHFKKHGRNLAGHSPNAWIQYDRNVVEVSALNARLFGRDMVKDAEIAADTGIRTAYVSTSQGAVPLTIQVGRGFAAKAGATTSRRRCALKMCMNSCVLCALAVLFLFRGMQMLFSFYFVIMAISENLVTHPFLMSFSFSLFLFFSFSFLAF